MFQIPNHLDRSIGLVREQRTGGAEKDEGRGFAVDSLVQPGKEKDCVVPFPETNIVLAGGACPGSVALGLP